MDGEGIVYSLDEALATVGFGKFQIGVLSYAGLCLFAEAMEIMILSFVGLAVKSEWGLSSNQESLITSVVFIGMLFGAYSWGLISDNYGRRKGILGSTILTSVAGLLSAFSPNYVTLVSLRCLVGVGLGGSPVFSSWFLEFVPPSNRGMWMVVYSTFWTLGTIFEASLAWIVMPRMSWRWLLGISSLPAISLLIFYRFTPESPRYLCTKGRIDEAQKVLHKVALVNQTKLPIGILVSDYHKTGSVHIPLVLSDKEKVSSSKLGRFSSFYMLFSSKLIRTTLLLWVLYFANAFSYYGIVLLTSELSGGQSKCGGIAIFNSEKLANNSLYSDVLITSLAELPGLVICAMILDRVGRKLSMIIMSLFACIFLLPLISPQPTTLQTLLLFGARMWSSAIFTVACIYCPELYPTSVRTTGAGVASAVGRIGGVVCPLVTVGLVNGCHVKEAIALFEIVIAISVVSLLLFPFETKGRELSDDVSSFHDHKQDFLVES